MTNQELVERYPFLAPRDWETGEIENGYDYSWTELDAMPDGWREAFGEMMCEEIRDELIKYDFLNEYSIAQIKEKYGRLCWYDNGWPEGSNIPDIIGKYECLSENICISCGKPDVPLTGIGWYMPLCRSCYVGNPEDWLEFFNQGHRMVDFRCYRSYRDGEWRDVKIDIRDTAQKIRDKYKEAE